MWMAPRWMNDTIERGVICPCAENSARLNLLQLSKLSLLYIYILCISLINVIETNCGTGEKQIL